MDFGKNKQKTVIVLGCPRSGTSLTAGLLRILGVDVGIGSRPDRHNPRGGFEDEDFAKMDSDIMQRLESLNSDNKKDVIKREFGEKIKKLIKEKSEDKIIWGWKHPPTVFTIDFYLSYLINPFFVIVFRNPIGVAKSLVEFNNKEIDLLEALKITDPYNDGILNFLRKYPGLPKIFITFEDLINNPIREAKKLSDFLGLKLKEEQIAEIKKFIIPRERIKQEKKKAKIIEPFTFRAPRFIKKCLKNPLKVPYYVYLAFKNNICGKRRRK